MQVSVQRLEINKPYIACTCFCKLRLFVSSGSPGWGNLGKYLKDEFADEFFTITDLLCIGSIQGQICGLFYAESSRTASRLSVHLSGRPNQEPR